MLTLSQDLTAVQSMLKADITLLTLMDLSGTAMTTRVNAYIASKPSTTVEVATAVIISKCITKKSQWSDLVGSDKRLCAYFIPSKPTRCQDLHEQTIEVDCHVPSSLDYVANDIMSRVATLLNKKQIQGRVLKVAGQLGELPTLAGFYCCGIRVCYYDPI